MSRLKRGNAVRQYGTMGPPPECAFMCNSAESETETLGKTPSLCAKGSVFINSYASCSECVLALPDSSFYQDVYLKPTFQTYLDYCTSIEVKTTSQAPVETTTPPSPTAEPPNTTPEPRIESTLTPPEEETTTLAETRASAEETQSSPSPTNSPSSPSPLLSPTSQLSTTSPLSTTTTTTTTTKTPPSTIIKTQFRTHSSSPTTTSPQSGPLITIITPPGSDSNTPPPPPVPSSSPPSSSSSLSLPLLLTAILVPLLLFTLTLLIAFCIWLRKRQEKQLQQQIKLMAAAPSSIFSESAQMIDGRSLYSLPAGSVVIGGPRSIYEADALPVYREVMGSHPNRVLVEMSAVRSVGEMSGGGYGNREGSLRDGNTRSVRNWNDGSVSGRRDKSGSVRGRERVVSDVSGLGLGEERRVRNSWE
ncbi:hypothetical protein QBC38DRAFT_540642 [Podospora fimiseda]|uniref:Uncharacterized protein n=1 Tax=Podospora fimiseda TaxID=252190 RepID=A0AAN7BZQ0_9PEZI|nr:hypothetical protein QBC38DRAFT_540642 [Podospora fimiseda]